MHCLGAESRTLLPDYRFDRSHIAAAKIAPWGDRFGERESVDRMTGFGRFETPAATQTHPSVAVRPQQPGLLRKGQSLPLGSLSKLSGTRCSQDVAALVPAGAQPLSFILARGLLRSFRLAIR
jgi:hypothetical protein